MSSAKRGRIVVVGGGPAGLASAIELRRAGARVVVVDRGHPPIDKACGEGVMPDGVARLRELGVDFAEMAYRPIRGLRFVDDDVAAEAPFPGAPGAGIRRLVLHRELVAAAERAGAELRWETSFERLETGRVVCDSATIEADLVVGADGLGSRVRRAAGLEAEQRDRPRRFGVRRHVRRAPANERVEVHFAAGIEAYVTPVDDETTGIALLWSPERLRVRGFDDGARRIRSLSRELREAPSLGPDLGAGPLRRRARRIVAPGLALVGDAAGYLDAITGEGLSIAFHHAAALAAAWRTGALERYEAAHHRLAAIPDMMTLAMLAIDASPAVRRRALRALARRPAFFSMLLGLHAQQAPTRYRTTARALSFAAHLRALGT